MAFNSLMISSLAVICLIRSALVLFNNDMLLVMFSISLIVGIEEADDAPVDATIELYGLSRGGGVAVPDCKGGGGTGNEEGMVTLVATAGIDLEVVEVIKVAGGLMTISNKLLSTSGNCKNCSILDWDGPEAIGVVVFHTFEDDDILVDEANPLVKIDVFCMTLLRAKLLAVSMSFCKQM